MRLIDADRFIEYMEEKCDMTKQLDPIIFVIVREALNEQPTAYDIDKVVEELEKSSKWVNETNEYGDDDGNDYIPLSKAIEIVNHGGVSDDVCEWKIKDTCYTSSIKHYDALPTPIVKTFTNCPYCSKKIKVVE